MKTNNKKITNIVLVGLIGIVIGINITLFSSSNIIASRDELVHYTKSHIRLTA